MATCSSPRCTCPVREVVQEAAAVVGWWRPLESAAQHGYEQSEAFAFYKEIWQETNDHVASPQSSILPSDCAQIDTVLGSPFCLSPTHSSQGSGVFEISHVAL